MRTIYLVPVAALALAACQQQPGAAKQEGPAADKAATPSAISTKGPEAPATATKGADAPAAKTAENAPVPASASACMTQDGKPLAVKPLRALGTEPFWGAEVNGRCVTYSTPDDQTGTRIWTRYTATADGGRWSGSLGGRKFELVTRKQADCSDGMSDDVFPMAAEVMVNGEQRKGCAKP